jgi:hypothetical protein
MWLSSFHSDISMDNSLFYVQIKYEDNITWSMPVIDGRSLFLNLDGARRISVKCTNTPRKGLQYTQAIVLQECPEMHLSDQLYDIFTTVESRGNDTYSVQGLRID